LDNMATGTQTHFNLSPRIIVQTVDPYLIEGEDAPAILDEVNGVIDSEFGGNKVLKVLSLGDDGRREVVGSSSLILPVVNRVVSPQFRVMRPERLERTLREGDPVGVKRNQHYVNYGIFLDFSGRNHNLALEFHEQLPEELRDIDRLPALVVGYGLANSERGDYGVCPAFIEGTELRTAKVLAGETGNFYANDAELILSGVPSRVGGGTRKLFTVPQGKPSLDNLGFSGLGLNGGLHLEADGGNFAYSYVGGRVVLESGEVGV
jgi:hypothetical protein